MTTDHNAAIIEGLIGCQRNYGDRFRLLNRRQQTILACGERLAERQIIDAGALKQRLSGHPSAALKTDMPGVHIA